VSLKEQRIFFTLQVATLIEWASSLGYDLAFDEARVFSPRRVRKNGETFFAEDAVHKKGSRHHDGRAVDLLLYIDGKYISNGDHPAWARLGEFWKSLSPHLTWGGDFPSKDANHFSIFE